MSSEGASDEKIEKKPIPRGLLGRKGAPLASGTRLPSIKGPRDLTLGGVKKKTFAPKITARKEKSKDGSNTENVKKENPKPNPRGGKSNRGRGRGRGKNKADFIQTQGSVFGEGPADRMIKRGSWGSGNSEGTSSLTRPKINIKSEHKVCKEEEDATLKHLLRDDFVDDPDDESDDNNPIHLPLMKILSISETKPIKPELKKDDDAKNVEEEVAKLFADEVKDVKPMKTESGVDVKLSDLFAENNENRSWCDQFSLFKFPDSLPGFAPSSDVDPKSDKKSTSSSSTQKNEKPPEEEVCTFSKLPEGLVGKLQIRKSGKMQLMLGNVCLNIESGTQVGFLEDLVTIDVPDNDDRPTLTHIGNVKQRVICIPELDSILS